MQLSAFTTPLNTLVGLELGFRVLGLGFRVLVLGLGFRVLVLGLGLRLELGSWLGFIVETRIRV